MVVRQISESVIADSMRLIVRVLAAGRLKTLASGVEHIPSKGPALLVVRHYHHLFDGLALYAAVPRPLHILVTLDWATNQIIARLMQGLTRIARWPVILREDALKPSPRGPTPQRRSVFLAADVPRFQRRALRESVELLNEGRLLVVFPEGYPNIDPNYTPKSRLDEFLPFRAGFAAIAEAAARRLSSPLPIIPVGLQYTHGRPWIARVKFGNPVFWTDFPSRNRLIGFVEKEVRELSGEPAQT